MSLRESSQEADRDVRDAAFRREVARRGSKRRRFVFRELMVYSIALNTARKDNSLRSELYEGFYGVVGSNS